MGHQRVGVLPDTAPWRRVVGLIAEDGGVAAIAAAVTDAPSKGLDKARDDASLAYSVWLLAQFARAAHQEDFAAALRDVDVVVPDSPGVFDIVSAFTDAIDRRLFKTRD